MRVLVYSLRQIYDRLELSIDLTGKILQDDERSELIKIKLDDKVLAFRKWEWLNTFRVYSDGVTSFIICTKHISRQYAYKVLLEFEMSRMETMAEHYRMLKKKLQRELVAA